MRTSKEIISIAILFLISLHGYSQVSLENRKGTFNLTYKFNFADDTKTKEYASNGHSILINRTFTINQMLSLAPTMDYSYLKGYEKQHNFSIGTDAFLYPLHLISILKEEEYNPKKDKYFLSLGLYKTLNKGNINSIFNMNFYVYTLEIGNQLKISPTLGVSFYNLKEQEIEDMTFSNIGLIFRF